MFPGQQPSLAACSPCCSIDPDRGLAGAMPVLRIPRVMAAEMVAVRALTSTTTTTYRICPLRCVAGAGKAVLSLARSDLPASNAQPNAWNVWNALACFRAGAFPFAGANGRSFRWHDTNLGQQKETEAIQNVIK